MQTNILLESGTGEVEILEFIVNGIHYGINVIKVKEILEVDCITKLPNVSPAVAGLTLVRGDVVTVIDLKYILENVKKNEKKSKTILCEFNKMKVAFSVDSVVGIHRIEWKNIKKPNETDEASLVIAHIVFREDIILLLDFEKIVMDINPNAGINEKRMKNIKRKDRRNIKVILADDSILIRRVLNDTLVKAGFKDLRFFDDGEQTLQYLESLVQVKGENFMEDVQILITDIEMPKMDGHTLTRKIKEHAMLKQLPVIIFSSLITEDLKHKGEAVGANEQLSKPEIGELVLLIDEYAKNKN